MRVVAGSHRSRKLKAPVGKNTRPTTDKVKGAIFNMIGPYFDGGKALDLYAGSGGLGIEALSRGIDYTYFVDNNYQALKTIKENLTFLNLNEQADVLKKDANQALQTFADQGIQFDLVLLDPPYAKQELAQQLQTMIDDNILAPEAMIVCEVDKDVEIDVPKKMKLLKNSLYGITKILIYQFEGV